MIHTTPFGIPHEKHSNTPTRFFLGCLRWTSRSWDEMERDVKVVLRREAVESLRYISANRTTPRSGTAWRTSINNIADVCDLWSPGQCKAPSRDSESLSLYAAKSKLGYTLLFSHLDMVSFKHMRTSHFKALLQGGERIVGTLWELCGTLKPNWELLQFEKKYKKT